MSNLDFQEAVMLDLVPPLHSTDKLIRAKAPGGGTQSPSRLSNNTNRLYVDTAKRYKTEQL
jgi:hypothetical protein